MLPTQHLAPPVRFGGPDYKGPGDGRSRKASSWVRPVITAAARVTSRMSVEGLENVPETGGNIYCPNHPATSLDVYIPHIFAKGDLRTMVRIKRFESETMADLSEATGHYPVDRNNASNITKEHTLEVLRNDGDVLIFPEGRFSEKTGQVSPLKRGAASFAYKAAKKVVPVGYHFEADKKFRPVETLLAAAGAGAIGAAAGGLASPVAGGVLGAAIGSKFGRWVARKVIPSVQSDTAMVERLNHDPIIMAGVSIVGGVVGGIAGAVGGAFCSIPAALGVGVGAFSLMKDYIHRPVTKVKIGEAMDIEPYRKMEKRAANTAITEEIHRQVGALVSDLSGVPYDDSGPKIFRGSGSPEKKKKPAVTAGFLGAENRTRTARRSRYEVDLLITSSGNVILVLWFAVYSTTLILHSVRARNGLEFGQVISSRVEFGSPVDLEWIHKTNSRSDSSTTAGTKVLPQNRR